MKKFYTVLIAIIFTSLFVGCCDNSTPEELSSIRALKSPDTTKINGMRLTALKETARGLAAQAGLSWRSKQINTMLITQKSHLDHIFNFNYLILQSNVMPPVLVEGRNVLNMPDENSIRASDRDFQIVYPPRFITAPPTWRDYIWMQYKKPETPNGTLLPKNSDERDVWNEYVKIGWNEGVQQADRIFKANLNRLTRDYNGMVLYRILLAQNMVTPPYVSQAQLGVTGGGNDMRINDRVLRITAISELKSNPKTWNPVLGAGTENPEEIYGKTAPKCHSQNKNKI